MTAKPLPKTQPWTRAFWDATKEEKLLIQKCEDCQSLIFFPRKVCPECWSEKLEWIAASGRATVYSFTVMTDMVEPKFMGDLPYVLAWVDLEEGIRMTTRIVQCRPEDVYIGMAVDVCFMDIEGECNLPVFAPSDPGILLPEEKIDNKAGQKTGRISGMDPSTYETITYEIADETKQVCTITLNRPDQHNSINRRMAAELVEAFRRVKKEPDVGVVLFCGAGKKAFCSGGDLEIFPSLAEHQAGLNWLSHDGLDVQRAITDCEKVVICKIDGYCLAGGLELALCCDLIYAKESAKLGTTEINMGILPGWGGTARLPRSMPIFRAREMIFSGRKDYTAAELYDMGLLTRVFKDEEFEARFDEVVKNISSKKPIALRMGKEVMARSFDGGSMETALAVERNGIQWLSQAPDIQAMLSVFKDNSKELVKTQRSANKAADRKE